MIPIPLPKTNQDRIVRAQLMSLDPSHATVRPATRMAWKEKKTERIRRCYNRLPIHDGRGRSWALQQDEAAL
jgi:hypothetical protein